MNIALAQNISLQEKLRQQWIRWKQQRKYFPNIVMWWERVVKKQIRLLFMREGTEAGSDAREVENFHHACLYKLITNARKTREKTVKINHLKAKLVELLNTTRARGMIEVPPPDLYQDEQMLLFHLIKRRKRRTITHIMDPNGELQTSMKGILNTFSDCLQRKYVPIHVDDGCIRRMATAGHQRLPEAWKVTLDRPLTTDELYGAIYK
jgi:hypothetical protein